MDINRISVPLFKEFAELNNLKQFRNKGFQPFKQQPRKQTLEPHSFDLNKPLAHRSDARNLFAPKHPFTSERWPGQGMKNVYHADPKFHVREVESKIRLDSQSVNVSKQSTDLQIRTKDGDLVTISIREKERVSDTLKLEHVQGQFENNGDSVQIESKESTRKSERFNLDAMLNNGEVEDMSFEMESKSKSNSELNFQVADDDSVTNGTYQSHTFSKSNIEFEVDGHLDKDELEAIGALLDDVDELATEFFDGDVQLAFQQASQLSFDDSEIASYALSLKEHEVSVVSEKYQQYQPQSFRLPPPVSKPIAGYLDRLKSVEEFSFKYLEQESFFNIMKGVAQVKQDDDVSEEASDYFSKFNEKWLNQLNEILG